MHADSAQVVRKVLTADVHFAVLLSWDRDWCELLPVCDMAPLGDASTVMEPTPCPLVTTGERVFATLTPGKRAQFV
jgi:hypothetical protein